jgi:RNA polymerase sigma-70 factor (ECF subfamily)
MSSHAEVTRASDPFGTDTAFARLVAPHRTALQAHCYRMLGSLQDAEDALQETLLRAWRGLPGFRGTSSLRTWLYRIATNVCLRALERRPRRALPDELSPPTAPHEEPGGPAGDVLWLEPYPDAGLEYEARESVELAFIAALQHLPERQRAVLLLRDVLGFAPAEIAEALGTTAAAVSSTLQRAHRAVEEKLPEQSQQAALQSIGDERLRAVVDRYVTAWEEADVDALVAMLAEDATFAMPPRAAWFRGPEAIGAFLAAHPLDRPGRWRRERVGANGQLAFAAYQRRPGRAEEPQAIELLTLTPDGRIAGVMAFHGIAFAPFTP